MSNAICVGDIMRHLAHRGVVRGGGQKSRNMLRKGDGFVMAKKKPDTETVYRIVKRGCAGVISHAPNCGYTDAQLKSLSSKGYKLKVEVRNA